jgi:hypothetical protein
MHDLWFGREGDLFHLDGVFIQPPVTGCCYQAGSSTGATVEDLLTVTLESDNPADFHQVIRDLERSLTAALTYRERGLGSPVRLGVQPLGSDDCWSTLIQAGYLEMAGSGLADQCRGRMQLQLHFTRVNEFEGGEVELPLSNRNGSHATGGLAVHNHADSGHDNHVLIDGLDVPGDLPGRFKLVVTNTTSGAALRNLVAVLNIHSNPAGFEPVFEAESASGGVTNPSSACSGGSYKTLSWSVAEEVELLTWVMSAARVWDAGGNAFRFLLRLVNPPSYTDLWLKLRVKAGGQDTVIGETDWALVKAGECLQELGPSPLPPGALPSGASGTPLKLVLVARRQAAGGHTFSLDYLALLALDGYRRYQGIACLPAGAQLVDDPLWGVAAYQPGSGWLATHLAFGAPLELTPGVGQRLTFFHDEDGGLAPIERSLSIRAWYRPSRRIL